MERRDNRFAKGVLTGILCSLAVAAAATWGIYFLLTTRQKAALPQEEQAAGLDYG